MYQILYHTKRNKDYKKYAGRCLLLSCLMFFIFCVFVFSYCPEGRSLLQALLIPGDPETTLQAAEVFAAEVGAGCRIQDALKNLYSSVIGYGYTG